MNQYIITEEEWQSLKAIHRDLATHGAESDAWLIMENVRSHPYNPQEKIYATNEQLGRIMDEYEARKDEREKVLKRFNDELEELDCFGDMCCRDYLKTVVTALRQEGTQEAQE